MQSIFIPLDPDSRAPMYQQIYEYVRRGVLSGKLAPGERLPSLRGAAKALGVSVTTLALAYGQLAMEGYIESCPKSGYFVSSQLPADMRLAGDAPGAPAGEGPSAAPDRQAGFVDPDSFDFARWRKCLNQVLGEQASQLYSEALPQGEPELRDAIARYVYRHRGVRCTPGQIVLGAGVQPVIEFLCQILRKEGVRGLAMEDPGFLPVQRIFAERGFEVAPVPVGADGISLGALPQTPMHIAYVSPSNQFPTGAVIPVGKRIRLIEWAARSGNFILEDDYDSELRYWGKPIPALQGLDSQDRVVYLGSFSTTLFPSLKISYMILPAPLMERSRELLVDYRQTCSKTEQLALALFIRSGQYQTHIKKLRRLCAQKMDGMTQALREAFGEQVRILRNTSGVHMLLAVSLPGTPESLCRAAEAAGLSMVPVRTFAGAVPGGEEGLIVFYYTRVPLGRIRQAVALLRDAWESPGAFS